MFYDFINSLSATRGAHFNKIKFYSSENRMRDDFMHWRKNVLSCCQVEQENYIDIISY